jgi:hypothetical protein
MSEKIETLEQVAEVLVAQGYAPRLEDGQAVMLDVGGTHQPFAAVITKDDASATDAAAMADAEKWPIVLTSSVPIGDLSEGELCVALDGLWNALSAAGPVLKLGLSE